MLLDNFRPNKTFGIIVIALIFVAGVFLIAKPPAYLRGPEGDRKAFNAKGKWTGI